MSIITSFTEFAAVNEAVNTTYTGFYRRELVGAVVDVTVDSAKYDPKTGSVEFRCAMSTVDEVLKASPLRVVIHKGGALSATPDKDGQVYLDAHPQVAAELQQLIATVNKRPQGAAASAHVLERAASTAASPWFSAAGDFPGGDAAGYGPALEAAGFEDLALEGSSYSARYKGHDVVLDVNESAGTVSPSSEQLAIAPVRCASMAQLVGYIDLHLVA
jgi:hypothetical protein